MQHRFANRTELILAAALVVGGIGFLLISRAPRRSPDSRDPAAATGNVSSAGFFSVKTLKARRDAAFVHLTLETAVRNSATAPLVMSSPSVRLLAGGESEVPRFIAPFLSDPVVAPGVEATVELHYWLPVASLREPLDLEISGRRERVKEAEAFPADDLSGGDFVTVSFPQWRVARK